MFAKVITAGVFGVKGFKVETETDSSTGFPSFNMVGALSKEVKEARFRVSTALKNSGYSIRPKKYTVNLSPAGINKEGTGYDLSIAVAVLISDGVLKNEITDIIKNYAFIGELGLDGEVKPVRGVLPMSVELSENGVSGIITSFENAAEASLSGMSEVIGVRTLRELMSLLKSRDAFFGFTRTKKPDFKPEAGNEPDFSEVKGQEYIKRAMEIAASGGHNILLTGPAGTGKTMLASRLPGILPRLTPEEDLKISEIYSICGLLPHDRPLLGKRPFRAPHHSVTPTALTGGGVCARPGELSLASKGVLFLDELPLFPQATIELLRQPLESKKITVTRLKGVFEYPADFLFVAAMNPCPCGFYPDRAKCRCTEAKIRTYQASISKPLMERIDICARTRIPDFEELGRKSSGERSEKIRERVEETRERQLYRIKKYFPEEACAVSSNSGLTGRMTEEFCRLGSREEEFIRDIFKKKGLSARLYHKVLRLSRTIADMEGSEAIAMRHIAEACALRNGDDSLWHPEISERKES